MPVIIHSSIAVSSNMFANDIKVFRKITNNRQHLQGDLNQLTKWPEMWQMLFNFWICVRASTQDMGMKMHNIQWVVL